MIIILAFATQVRIETITAQSAQDSHDRNN